jgi:hypothetical protein
MTKTKHLNMDIDNEATDDLVEVEEVAEEQEEVVERQQESLEDKESRLERQLNQTRKKMGKDEPKQKAKQSDSFDYGEQAFIEQRGIKSNSDTEFLRAEMQDSGKSLKATLDNPRFLKDLEQHQALEVTANAVPTGQNANSTATDSVEYWSAKPIAEVPADMRSKVVNAKIAKERDVGKFYNS